MAVGQNFPRVGLIAILELTGFKKNANQYFSTMAQLDRTTKQTAQSISKGSKQTNADIATTFGQLTAQSQAYQNYVNALGRDFPKMLADSEQAFRKIFDSIALGSQVSVSAFDKLTASGVNFEDALKGAIVPTQQEEQSVNILGKSFTMTAFAVAAATTGLTAYINLVRSSIQDFTDFAEQVRRIRLELGVTTEEASVYVRAAEANSTSTKSLAFAFGQLERNLINYKFRLDEGSEETTNFQRALFAVVPELKDTDITLLSTSEIITKVNDKLKEMGPGWITSGEAQDIYGRGAYNLLPLLISEGRSLEDVERIMRGTASVMSTEGMKANEDYQVASLKLNLAWKSNKAVIANEYLPILTELKNALADVLLWVSEVDASTRALGFAIHDMAINAAKGISFGEAYRTEKERLLNVMTEEAKRAEELELARQREIQQNVLLERAAAERADQIEELNVKIVDAAQDLQDKLSEIEEQSQQRWDDMMLQRSRDTIERTLRLSWDLQDAERELAQRREDILSRFNERQAERQRETADRTAEFIRDAQRRREKLERDHQERLLQIQLDYQDSIDEAVRHNDAVAVLQAMRQKARETRDEQRKYASSREELEQDLADRRQALEEDRIEREREAQVERERALEQLRIDYARQEEERKRSQERERILREMHYRWEEQDFRKAKDRQIAEAKKRYNEEYNELQTQLGKLKGAAVASINNMGAAAATATTNAIRRISSAASSEILRYGHLLVQLGGALAVTETSIPTIKMAEGGTIFASSPTNVVMGDAGPEVATFTPLGRSMTVNHRFNRFGVDFGGVPSGMDTSRVESLVYNVMSRVAEQLLAGA